MEIKAVFFDIDGTLVNDSRMVLKSTEKAIRALKEQGIFVGLATGRGPFFVRPFIERYDFDFAVTYNGQYIFTKDKVLSASPIDKKNLHDLIDYAKKHRIEIALGTEDGVEGSRIMSFGLSPISLWSARFVPKGFSKAVSQGFKRWLARLSLKTKSNCNKLPRTSLSGLLLASPKDTQKVEQAFPELKFTRSSPFAADVINPDNSKMEGIRIVGEEFGFSMDQVMAFGDSDNDLEMLSGVGLSIAMGNGTSRVKEVAQHTTTSNTKDGIQKALEHFGIITDQSLFVSRDDHFNKVKAFHQLMDGQTQEEPKAWDNQEALYRTMFKQEELVEFIRAASKDEATFDRSIESLHQALDEAANKVRSKHPAEISMVGQVDALIDTLYLTYGSFVLMGVDPEEVFEIVHRANMGKIFPDGQAHFDEVTHKILKPNDWEEKYAPEPAIQKELERQIKAYQKHYSEKTAESEENKKV
ncbi:MAG: Cof-type HAD-IIB family hydrolase [Streptococcus sp.]